MSERTISKGTWAVLTLVVAVAIATFVAGAVVGSGDPLMVPGRYTHTQLQSDADMTQQMSVPGASGPMTDGGVVDDQLRRAQQDPGYLRQLEDHQRAVDRMLGRAAE